MLKKTITFKDYNDNELTEDFYFNLSKAEIAEMELSQSGGLAEYLKKIVAEEDGKKLVEMFKELIQKSVGKRSVDGRRFIKNQDIVDDFCQTEAYSELFVELATNAEQAAAFVQGIVPSDLDGSAQAKPAQDVPLPAVSDVVNPVPAAPVQEPAWLTEGREPTPEEVRDASPEQLRMLYTRKLTVTPKVDEVPQPPPA